MVKMKTGKYPINYILKTATILAAAVCIIASFPLMASAADLPYKLEQIISNNLENQPAMQDALSLETTRVLNAGVSAELVSDILQKSFEKSLSPNDIGTILENIAVAGEKNLTVKPLTDKVLEGIAKGVDLESILYAMDLTARRLDTADKLVQSLDGYSLSREEKQHLAEDTVTALATGVSEDGLKEVFAGLRENTGRYGNQEPDDVVDLVQSLVGLGVDSAKAVELTERIMDREDMESEDIQDIQEAVFKERRKSKSTSKLLSAVAEILGDDDQKYSEESSSGSGYEDGSDEDGGDEGGEGEEGGEGGED